MIDLSKNIHKSISGDERLSLENLISQSEQISLAQENLRKMAERYVTEFAKFKKGDIVYMKGLYGVESKFEILSVLWSPNVGVSYRLRKFTKAGTLGKTSASDCFTHQVHNKIYKKDGPEIQ